MNINWPLLSHISLLIFFVLVMIRMTWLKKAYPFYDMLKRPYASEDDKEDIIHHQNESSEQDIQIFYPNDDNHKIIEQYMISKNKSDKSLIIKYLSDKENVDLKIFVYQKNLKLIKIIQLKDHSKKTHSNIIKLPKKSEMVNIISSNDDDKTNHLDILKINHYYALYDSLLMFLYLLPIFYYLTRIIGQEFFESYLLRPESFNAIIVIFMISVFNFTVQQSLLNQYIEE